MKRLHFIRSFSAPRNMVQPVVQESNIHNLCYEGAVGTVKMLLAADPTLVKKRDEVHLRDEIHLKELRAFLLICGGFPSYAVD